MAGDASAKGKNPEEIAVQEHTITEVTELLIYVKGLRGHIDGNVVMALELEEITDLGPEGLIVAVVPNHADFIQKKKRIRLGDEIAQVLYIKMAYTRDKKFIHIGVDIAFVVQVDHALREGIIGNKNYLIGKRALADPMIIGDAGGGGDGGRISRLMSLLRDIGEKAHYVNISHEPDGGFCLHIMINYFEEIMSDMGKDFIQYEAIEQDEKY